MIPQRSVLIAIVGTILLATSVHAVEVAQPSSSDLPLSEQWPKALQEHDYLQAEKLLRLHIDQCRSNGLPASGYRYMVIELAHVYLDSGMHAPAEQLLASCHSQLLREVAGPLTLVELSDVSIMLTQTLVERGRTDEAVRLVRQSLARFPADAQPASQLELLVQLYLLGERSRLQDAPQADLTGEIHRFAKIVANSRGSRAVAIPPDRRRQALKSLTAIYVQARQFDRALHIARRLQAEELGGKNGVEAGVFVAEIERAAGNSHGEAAALKGALEISDSKPQLTVAERYERGDLCFQRAEILERDGQLPAAAQLYREAGETFRELLKILDHGSADGTDAGEPGEDAPPLMTVLERVVETMSVQMELGSSEATALHAAAIDAHRRLRDEYSAKLLPDDARTASIRLSLAGLYIAAAIPKPALAVTELTEAKSFWERHTPRDQLMLARTLNLLGEAHLVGVEPVTDAENYFQQAEAVCLEHHSTDELLGWIRLNRARWCTAVGKYAEAQRVFALLSDSQQDKFSPDLHSSMLLHEGLLLKQMQDYSGALDRCQKSLAIIKSQPRTPPQQVLNHYLALIGLQIALRDADGLESTLADPDIAKLASLLADNGSGAYELMHAQAMVPFLRYESDARRFTAAPDTAKPEASEYAADGDPWKSMREDGVRTKLSDALLVRVLQHSARLEYLKWSIEAALAQGAVAEGDLAEAPVLSAEHQEHLTDAKEYLDQAVAKLGSGEQLPNLRYAVYCGYGEVLRALGKHQEAVAVLNRAIDLATRLRQSRSLAIESRAEFFVNYHTAFDLLVRQHVERKEFIEAIIAAERSRSLSLLEQMRAASLSPDAEVLAALEPEQVVAHFQDRKQPVLYYYLGAERSYAIVLGQAGKYANAIPLRTFDDSEKVERARFASASDVDGFVRQILEAIQDPDVRATKPEVAAAIVPLKVQQFLREESKNNAPSLIVVPHGVLSRLPLEGLLVAQPQDGKSEFLLDIAPPLVYTPSLTVMRIAEEWPAIGDQADRSVVTYAAADVQFAAGLMTEPGPASAYTVAKVPSQADLPPLKEATNESQEVFDAFQDGDNFRVLQGLSGNASAENQATEENLRRDLRSPPTVLHIAAHGMANAEDGTLAAAIYLQPTAGAPPDPARDGILSLGEIHELKLEGCELAVLSACETNVSVLTAKGKDSPQHVRQITSALDPSFSLAAGFLAAGSRRVVASQWKVSDESTSALVGKFMSTLAPRMATNGRIDYARALADARRHVRDQKKWSAPYYWASFVLIGPNDIPVRSSAEPEQ